MKSNLFPLVVILTLAISACSFQVASETPVIPTPSQFYLTTLQAPLIGQSNDVVLVDTATGKTVKLILHGEKKILYVEEVRSDGGAGEKESFALTKEPIDLSINGWLAWDGIVVHLDNSGNVIVESLTSWQVK